MKRASFDRRIQDLAGRAVTEHIAGELAQAILANPEFRRAMKAAIDVRSKMILTEILNGQRAARKTSTRPAPERSAPRRSIRDNLKEEGTR